MEEFLRQLPALLGVAIGAMGSYLLTSAQERVKWKRDRLIRWDSQRLDAYLAYGISLKRKAFAIARIAVDNGIRINAIGYESTEAAMQSLVEAEGHLRTQWELVLALGEANGVNTAREYASVIFSMEQVALRGAAASGDWQTLVTEMGVARSAYYDAIRHDLGIGSSQIGPDIMRTWFLRVDPGEF